MEGGLSDTILQWDYPRIIPARLGVIWFSGFRGEDLNVKVYDVRQMPSDGKSSLGLWPGELKIKFSIHNIIFQTQIMKEKNPNHSWDIFV